MNARTRFCLLGLILYMTLGFPAAAQVESGYPWTFEQVADGVYAALQPRDGRFDDSNATIILGQQEVVIVDSQSNPAAVRAVIAWIGEQTDAPVTLVINTHWHGDHTQGNALYRDAFGENLEIIGHETLLADVPERAASFTTERVAYFDAELPAARERLAQGVFRDGTPMTPADREEQEQVLAAADAWLEANRDARFVGPSRTYTSRQRLVRAGRAIELVHHEAHTRGDTVVWLPNERVAITGDLLDDMPYTGHGYPTSWRQALTTLRALPIERIVPGHGPVFSDLSKLDALDGFLGALIAHAEAAVAGGADLTTTIEAADMSTWRDRLAADETAATFFDQALPEAIERAWLEARGELNQQESQ